MSMQTMDWAARVGGRTEVTTQATAQTAKKHENATPQNTRAAYAAEAIRRLRKEYIEERLRLACNASNAHYLYLELAARAKSKDCKALYQRLAEAEQRQLFRHTMRLKKLGHKPPKFQRTWFTKMWHRVLVSCAPNHVHKYLGKIRQGETRRQIELIRRQSDIRQNAYATGD